MNFMDRTAIGNARLYNMEEDLGLGEGEYQLAVSVLFITYCLFEVVSSQYPLGWKDVTNPGSLRTLSSKDLSLHAILQG